MQYSCFLVLQVLLLRHLHSWLSGIKLSAFFLGILNVFPTVYVPKQQIFVISGLSISYPYLLHLQLSIFSSLRRGVFPLCAAFEQTYNVNLGKGYIWKIKEGICIHTEYGVSKTLFLEGICTVASASRSILFHCACCSLCSPLQWSSPHHGQASRKEGR